MSRRYVLDDALGAAEACARDAAARLGEALAGPGRATLAVSGGNTPKPMFEKLAQLSVDWQRVHLFWVDERSVPPADPASNYKLAHDWLIAPAHIPEQNVHRALGEIPAEEAARRYAAEIRDFFGLAAGEMPQFDVMQCGMGPDGHTASLFPGEPLLDDREGITAAVFAPQFNQWRVTLLPGPLLAARHLLYLVSGDDKAETLHAVFHGEYNPKKYPSQIALKNPSASWYLDRAAARLLE